MSSGQIEWTNWTNPNQKDWDIKRPLVLMAIRATPHKSTSVPPFELMTNDSATPSAIPAQRHEPRNSLCHSAITWRTTQPPTHHNCFCTTTAPEQRRRLESLLQSKGITLATQGGGTSVVLQVCSTTTNCLPSLVTEVLAPLDGPIWEVDKLSPVAYSNKFSSGQKEPILRWVHRNQIKRHMSSDRPRKGVVKTN